MLTVLNPIRRLLARIVPGYRPPEIDVVTEEFIRFNRRKRDRSAKAEAVLLVGFFTWRPSICAYSLVASQLAARLGARLESYYFGKRLDKNVLPIYEAMGAPLTLGWASTVEFEKECEQLAKEWFAGLRSKEDVFRIHLGEIVLGDLIYDSYLRYYYEPTVRVDDARLLRTINEALKIAKACERFFAENRVAALLPYDAPYIESGVVHRYAIRHQVPIFVLEYQPITLHRMDGQMLPGDPGDYRNWPSKMPLCKFSPTLFAGLDREQQKRGQERAHRALSEHFQGRIADKTLAQYGVPTAAKDNAFRPSSEEPVFAQTGRPRVLVMLHDFCDAPNVYRWALFPDFDEWLGFLMKLAPETGFDWYIKPHPNRHFDRRMNEANDRIVAELKVRFPQVTFLSPKVSNRQILEEGISAMFTVFGTAAHEFAYHGVPVVTAGDNPQIDYSFNFHARTREEYRQLVLQADRLQIDIDRADIERFYYLYHFYPYEQTPSGVSILPEKWSQSPDLSKLESSTEVYRQFMDGDSPDRDRKIANYVDAFLEKQGCLKPSSSLAAV